MNDEEKMIQLEGIKITAMAPEVLESEIDRDALILALEQLAADIDNFITDWRVMDHDPLPLGIELSIAHVVR